MLRDIYDQNGHLLREDEIQKRNNRRWSTLFSKISDFNNCNSVTSKNQSITEICKERLKSNRRLRIKTPSKSNTTAGGQIDFDIPQFVIEGGNDSGSSKPQSANVQPQSLIEEKSTNFLKIASHDKERDVELKPRKLQIGVADFAKKVKDNEGMGISTFINEEDEEVVGGENETKTKHKLKKGANIISALRTEHFIKMSQMATEIRRKQLNKSSTPMEKFYHGVKVTRLLMKTCRTSSEQTRLTNNTFLTFADYQDNHEVKSQHISFDVSHYKAKKEKTLNSEAIEVMVTNPKMRTPEMLHVALLGLNSTVEAFGEFPISMQESLIGRGWYEKFESKRTIIRQGHSALNFYLIISGITVVSVARQNKATGETYSETVAFLKRGNSFGELALMFGGKRSATVSCKTDVELLAVSREDFIDIFMSVSSQGEPDHISFLRELPLLNQWPIDELPYDDPSICLFTYFRRGTVLCHDSNHGDWVYIVKSGTCRIIRLIQLESKIGKNTERSLKNPIFHSEYLTFLTQESLFGSNQMAKYEIPPPEIKITQDVNGKFYVLLKVLGSGSIFGMEPMAFEFVGGTSSVTLVSDGAELIAIERKFFQKHMTRQYQSWLRKELQPFPSIDGLKYKLRNFYRWTDYKEMMIRSLMNEGLNL